MQSNGQSPGERYRFNPPPGWPAYPPGWVPPPGWQPDPSWPPAPPGWPFWSQIESPPARPKRRLVRWIQIGAAVITFTATVVGLGLAIENRPKPYRLSDWATKANAACEKDFQNIMEPVLTVTPQLAAAFAASQAGGADNDRLTQISKQLVEISGAFRSLTGDLRGIEVPKGDAPIADLLKTGDEISNEFSGVALVLTESVANTATADNMALGAQAMQRLSATSMPSWSRLTHQLNLDQCEIFGVPGSSGPSAPPTAFSPAPGPTSPGAAQLTRAEQTLVARIKTSVLIQCVPPQQGVETGQVTAGVNCGTAQPGPTKLPLVMQFSNPAAMNQWIGQWSAGITSAAGATCPGGRYNAPWTSNATSRRAGQLVCRQLSAGDFAIAWTFDTAGVLVYAESSDAASLFQWWQNNAYLLISP